jgi:hypothetical protein
VLTRDEARRIAAKHRQLPEQVSRPEFSRLEGSATRAWDAAVVVLAERGGNQLVATIEAGGKLPVGCPAWHDPPWWSRCCRSLGPDGV